MSKMLHGSEFPGYISDIADLIPANWVDTSWHNDVCPSFEVAFQYRVWLDHFIPELRERNNPIYPRFMVTRIIDDEGNLADEPSYETDSFDELCAFVYISTAGTITAAGFLMDQYVRAFEFLDDPIQDNFNRIASNVMEYHEPTLFKLLLEYTFDVDWLAVKKLVAHEMEEQQTSSMPKD